GKLVARRVGESDGIAPGPGDAIEVAIALAVNDDRGVDCARSVRQGRDGLKLGYVSKPVGGERKLHNDGFGRGGNRPDLWRTEVLRSILHVVEALSRIENFVVARRPRGSDPIAGNSALGSGLEGLKGTA